MKFVIQNTEGLLEDALKVGNERLTQYGLGLILEVVAYWQADDDEGPPEYWLVDLAL